MCKYTHLPLLKMRFSVVENSVKLFMNRIIWLVVYKSCGFNIVDLPGRMENEVN